MKELLEQIEEGVRIVPADRMYWFVRTYSGQLFEEYLEKGYIGIGLNQVPYGYVRNASRSNEEFTVLHKFLTDTLQYKQSEATRWANQLIHFEHSVKPVDIVIMPSTSSEKLAIGVVTGDTYLVDDSRTFRFDDKFEPYPQKRKNVEWLKRMDRSEFLGDIRGMLSSHSAISDVGKYGDFIEGNISSLFIRDEQGFFNIRIKQDEEINAFELHRYLDSITYFYKEFCKEMGLEPSEDLTIKIKVQSKGNIVLKTLSIGTAASLFGLILLSSNEHASFNIGKFVNMEVTGHKSVLESISDFLDRNQERKMKWAEFQRAKKALEAEPVVEGMSEPDSTNYHPDGGRTAKAEETDDGPKKLEE